MRFPDIWNPASDSYLLELAQWLWIHYNPKVIFYRGNSKFAHGDYKGAIKDYKKLISKKIFKDQVFYNIASSQFNLLNNEAKLETTMIGKQEEDLLQNSLEDLKNGLTNNNAVSNLNISSIKENKNYQVSPRSHG